MWNRFVNLVVTFPNLQTSARRTVSGDWEVVLGSGNLEVTGTLVRAISKWASKELEGGQSNKKAIENPREKIDYEGTIG